MGIGEADNRCMSLALVRDQSKLSKVLASFKLSDFLHAWEIFQRFYSILKRPLRGVRILLEFAELQQLLLIKFFKFLFESHYF